VADAATDKRHAEYYNQLLWTPDSWFAWLNRLGWVNEAILFFRTVFVPGASVLLPVIVFLAPLVLTHLLAGPDAPPMTFDRYVELVTGAFKKMMPAGLGKARFAGRGGILELGEQMVHLGVAGAMFVASIWNQLSAARTMRGVAADMRNRAASVRRAAAAVRDLAAALGVELTAAVAADPHRIWAHSARRGMNPIGCDYCWGNLAVWICWHPWPSRSGRVLRARGPPCD
jgi:hypothetical protein